MTRRMRLSALIIAMAILFVMLFSTFYVAGNTVHDCSQDNCPICQQLELCENALSNIAILTAVAAIISFTIIYISKSAQYYTHELSFHTLVSLRVKLSN